MQDLSKFSINRLRALEARLIDELKTRHFLSVSQAREQILHIARNAGISIEQLPAIKTPKVSGAGKVPMKFRNLDDATQVWSGRGRQPGWVKQWIESGRSLEETRL